jgi:hypothetical protein
MSEVVDFADFPEQFPLRGSNVTTERFLRRDTICRRSLRSLSSHRASMALKRQGSFVFPSLRAFLATALRGIAGVATHDFLVIAAPRLNPTGCTWQDVSAVVNRSYVEQTSGTPSSQRRLR